MPRDVFRASGMTASLASAGALRFAASPKWLPHLRVAEKTKGGYRP